MTGLARLRTLGLWLCADLADRDASEVARRVRAVLDAVAACVWLRPTLETPGGTLRDIAGPLLEHARARGGALVIGDRCDVALAVMADGIHLTSHSLLPADARKFMSTVEWGRTMFVSAAAHDTSTVRDAAPHVDALVVSPFGTVDGKAPALGPGRFAALMAEAPARWSVALGGIVDVAHATSAARSGACAIAVRRALLDVADPARECRTLHDAFVSASLLTAAPSDATPSAPSR